MINLGDVQLNTNVIDIVYLIKREAFKIGKSIFKEIRETNTHIQTNCPFHSNGQEQHPSFGIRKDNGLWHCFTCPDHNSGNLYSLVSRVLEIRDGKQWLIDRFDATQFVDDEIPLLDFSKPEPVKRKINKYYVSEEELKLYRHKHPYMYERKLTDDIIDKFDIGYQADYEYGPAITFPVRDKNGKTLFIARRCIEQKFYKYPESVEKPLYGIYEIHKYFKKVDELWVCESMLDALWLWVNNIPAVALNGLGTELQFRQLRDLDITTLVLATDNDKSGQLARKRIKENVTNKFIKEAVIPKNRHDINECTAEDIKNIEIKL